MDNGTMVESFKFLNYRQLAKNSLTSKRFRDVIRTHRHKLALLYVNHIGMAFDTHHFKPPIQIFGKELSSEEYNEWIVHNEYSKQIPLECQVDEMESTEDERELYELKGCFKVSPKLKHETIIFHARTVLNQENWPLFEHFIRLLTDPFIYIHSMELPTRNDILHLLEKAMNPDRNRLQCDLFLFYLEGNAPKFISWIKDYLRCDRLEVLCYNDSTKLNYDRALLDLFMTGEKCSSEVSVYLHDVTCRRDSFPKIVDDFVQKFLDLKVCDEYQVVKTVWFYVFNRSIAQLKEKYAEFFVKEEPSNRGTKYTFEFVNGNIGKKLQLTTSMRGDMGHCSLLIHIVDS